MSVPVLERAPRDHPVPAIAVELDTSIIWPAARPPGGTAAGPLAAICGAAGLGQLEVVDAVPARTPLRTTFWCSRPGSTSCRGHVGAQPSTYCRTCFRPTSVCQPTVMSGLLLEEELLTVSAREAA